MIDEHNDEGFWTEEERNLLRDAACERLDSYNAAPAAANWIDGVSGSLAEIPEEDYQEFLDCCRDVRNGESMPHG